MDYKKSEFSEAKIHINKDKINENTENKIDLRKGKNTSIPKILNLEDIQKSKTTDEDKSMDSSIMSKSIVTNEKIVELTSMNNPDEEENNDDFNNMWNDFEEADKV